MGAAQRSLGDGLVAGPEVAVNGVPDDQAIVFEVAVVSGGQGAKPKEEVVRTVQRFIVLRYRTCSGARRWLKGDPFSWNLPRLV